MVAATSYCQRARRTLGGAGGDWETTVDEVTGGDGTTVGAGPAVLVTEGALTSGSLLGAGLEHPVRARRNRATPTDLAA
jgi:hypothetical protein